MSRSLFARRHLPTPTQPRPRRHSPSRTPTPPPWAPHALRRACPSPSRLLRPRSALECPRPPPPRARPHTRARACAHLAHRAPRLTERLVLGLHAQAAAHASCCASARALCRAVGAGVSKSRPLVAGRPWLDREEQRGKKALAPAWPSSLRCSYSLLEELIHGLHIVK